MSHCSLLCFMFIKSVAVSTELHSDPIIQTTSLLSLLEQGCCILCCHLANWLPTLIVRKSEPDIPVYVGSMFQCTWVEDTDTFLSLTLVCVQLSTLLQVHNTRQMTVFYLLQACCVVLPKSHSFVICFAESECAGLSALHAMWNWISLQKLSLLNILLAI